MYSIKKLNDLNIAIQIGKFVVGPDVFDQTWAPNEKQLVQQSVISSLTNPNHQYWYVLHDGEIIASIGIKANKYGSGGWEMDSDYLAVHQKFRRQGIASELVKAMEQFVKAKKGRYIHILTCDIESYQPALKFWQNQGYQEVARIPDYYVPGEGRVDFFKKLD